MKKLSNSNVYIVIITILLCVIGVFLLRYFSGNREVLAYISSYEVNDGTPISYADSTAYASSWVWEFGNGDTSDKKSGNYTYKDPGVYKIRVTVDKDINKEFIINIKRRTDLSRDSLVRIEAPGVAMQNEIITFRGLGPSKEWRWSLGETGIIDSREQVAFYAYKEPGTYDIELMTEDTKYPVRHTIRVSPMYLENDTTDVLSLIGNDIRLKLQAIADGKPFNVNYNHIMNKYLCKNSNAMVTINNDKKNDFYSYCQGLRTIGLKSTTILEVIVVQSAENSDCIEKLYVSQFNHDD